MKLDDYAKAVNRKTKKNIVSKADEAQVVPRFDTGSFGLNIELGGGGPEGRIITLAGMDGDGKSALSLMMAAGVLKKHKSLKWLWIDAEGAFDHEWAALLGIDVDRCRIVRPDYAEQGYQIAIDALTEVDDLAGVTIDSVAAMIPKAEAEGDMEDQQVALQARLNGKFLRKAQRTLLDKGESGTRVIPTVLLINQLTTNIGGYGNPDIEAGGKKLRYYPSVKIILKKADMLDRKGKVWKYIGVNDEGVEPVAQAIKFYIEKNKTAPGKRRGHFWFFFDNMDAKRPKGSVDNLEEIVRYAFKYDIVKRQGEKSPMYDIPNPTTGEIISIKGKENMAEYIHHNEPVLQYIQDEVQKRVNKVWEDVPIEKEEEIDEAPVHEPVSLLDLDFGDLDTERGKSSEGDRSKAAA